MNKHLKFILAGVFLGLFLCLILLVLTVDVAQIGPAGTSVGLSSLNGAVFSSLGRSDSWYKATKLLGYAAFALVGAFILAGAVQWIRRGNLKHVDRQIFVLAALYAATAVLYVLFEKIVVNYRPVLMEGETFPEASFPSTHTMIAVTVFGSAAILAGVYLKPGGIRALLQILCMLMTGVIVGGRLVSGVHWFSDILGGVLISTALLFAFSGCLTTGPDGPEKQDRVNDGNEA